MNKIRIAIVGYGGMGHYHAHNIIDGNEMVEFAGAYDINSSRMDLVRTDGFRAYESMEELLSDAARCEKMSVENRKYLDVYNEHSVANMWREIL